MHIMGIPTLFIVDKNKKITRVIGAKPPDFYRQMFETLAAGEELDTPPLAKRDRVLRIALGVTIMLFAWMYAYWWLLPVGPIVIFSGLYDRSTFWRRLTAHFKRTV